MPNEPDQPEEIANAETQSTSSEQNETSGSPRPEATTRTENFLMIEIPRGASQQELVQAVTTALTTREVPFFKDRGRHASPSLGRSSVGDDLPPPNEGGYPGDRMGPNEALLIFLKEEGW